MTEYFAGRDTLSISGEELAKHIRGMEDVANSFVKISVINDDKNYPYLNVFTNIEGTLSDAQLYPVDKSDSQLSRGKNSDFSWVLLLIPIGLFLYLYKKRK